MFTRGRMKTLAAVAASLVAVVLAAPPLANAAPKTWDGGGAVGNWSLPLNWLLDIPPADFDELTFAGTVRLNTTNDFSALIVDQLAFSASAGAFTLGGNNLALSAGASIINTSSNTQTLNLGINFQGSGAIGTAGAPLTFNNAVGWSGALSTAGPGTITFNAPLVGSGGLQAGAALTRLGASAAYGGQTSVGGGSSPSVLRLLGGELIPNTSVLNVQTNGIFDLAGAVETVGGLQGSGTVQLGGGVLQVNSAGTQTFTGSITGFGALGKLGTGTLTLSGTNGYGGATLVNGGTLNLPNGLPFSGGLVSVNAGTLAASGTINRNVAVAAGAEVTATGSLVYSGRVSGSGVLGGGGVHVIQGTLAPGAGAGILSAVNLTLGPASTLEIELNGLSAGTQYDRLVVSADLVLHGTLSLLLGYSPVAGDTFDILDWGTLAGTFDTLHLPALGSSLAWDTSRLYLDGTLSVAAIPEPEAYALLLAGLGMLGPLARRRRKH